MQNHRHEYRATETIYQTVNFQVPQKSFTGERLAFCRLNGGSFDYLVSATTSSLSQPRPAFDRGEIYSLKTAQPVKNRTFPRSVSGRVNGVARFSEKDLDRSDATFSQRSLPPLLIENLERWKTHPSLFPFLRIKAAWRFKSFRFDSSLS